MKFKFLKKMNPKFRIIKIFNKLTKFSDKTNPMIKTISFIKNKVSY